MLAPKNAGWTVEERVARLEVAVEHLTTDMAEVKADVRGLHAKIDSFKDTMIAMHERLCEKLDARFALVDQRFSQVDARFAQIDVRFERLEGHIDRKLMAMKIWSLLLHLTIAAGLLGVMARGFHWLQ